MSKVLLAYEDYSEMLTIQSVLNKVGFDVLTTSNEYTLAQQILNDNPDIIIGYGRSPKISTLGVGRRLKEMPRWLGKVILIFPAGVKPDPADLAKVRMDMALEAPLEVTRLLQVLANFTNQDSRTLVERMMKAVAQEGQQRVAVAPPKPDELVIVPGAKESGSVWNVAGSSEIEDFNRLMGIAPEKEPEINLTSPARDDRGSGPTMISEPGKEKRAKLEVGDAGPSEVGSSLTGSDSQAKLAGLVEDPEKTKNRVKAYETYLAGLPEPTTKAHFRTEVKKAQKKLRADWADPELENQDKLRRQFVSFLFKKKD